MTRKLKVFYGYFLFVILFLHACEHSSSAAEAQFITQHGITWNFSEPVIVGQFVNGDYWVLDSGGGVKITGISPGYTTNPTTGRAMNGSMINPHTRSQGYDGALDTYNASLNAGIGISPGTPLILTGGNSLVSTISNIAAANSNASYVKFAAVLTCVSSQPAANSFRPGFSSTVKTIHSADSLYLSRLLSLAYPGTKPSLTEYVSKLQMPFLSHNPYWTVRNMHPNGYGLDNYYYPIDFAAAAVMLHMDYSSTEKMPLLVRFVQLGIDLFDYVSLPGITGWLPNGGHSSGYKWPILFAGIMLEYEPMKQIMKRTGDYLNVNGYGPGNPPPDLIYFAEDSDTFYVAQSDVDITNSDAWNPDTRNASSSGTVLCRPYKPQHLGMPEWGIRRATEPEQSDCSWGANYRTIQSHMGAWCGIAIAIYAMNAKSLWNHNVFFDYVDRYMAISAGQPDPFGYKVEHETAGWRPSGVNGVMYDTYRKKIEQMVRAKIEPFLYLLLKHE